MQLPDPELLRTFLACLDSGSLVKASEIVGRTPSAVTAQMQRLSEIVGQPIFVQSGRGRVVTRAGEELALHARRILEANRQAIISLRGVDAIGPLRLGATEDFAENGLPDHLRSFAASHPRVQIELRIGRSAEIGAKFERGELDVALTVRTEPLPHEIAVIQETIVWGVASGGLVGAAHPAPLALLDGACVFKAAALQALDGDQHPYWIAALSPSLIGIRTAVSAGLAVTPRTRRWLAQGISVTENLNGLDLPELGIVSYALRLHPNAPGPAATLADYLATGLG